MQWYNTVQWSVCRGRSRCPREDLKSCWSAVDELHCLMLHSSHVEESPKNWALTGSGALTTALLFFGENLMERTNKLTNPEFFWLVCCCLTAEIESQVSGCVMNATLVLTGVSAGSSLFVHLQQMERRCSTTNKAHEAFPKMPHMY